MTMRPRSRITDRFTRNLAPLRVRNFALFMAGHTISHTGRWVELTGTVWLVSELTHSPFLLGLVGIARAVPSLVLSPLAGVIADRVDQRRLLFWSQGLGLVASLGLGLLVLTGQVELWHVYAQVAIQAAITAFDAVARQALFPNLVPRAAIAEAVTLHATASRTSELVGPALGGIAIAVSGEAAPFLINAATFLALMGAVVGMRGVARTAPIAGSTLRGDLSQGLRHVLASPVLSGMLKLEVVFGILQLNAVMITIVARDVLRVGPEGLGGLLSAPAIGALGGVALLLGLGHARRQGRFVLVCSLVYAAVMVSFATATEYWLCFVVLIAIGLVDTLMTVTRQSIMQLAAPGEMRGRVMANMRTVTGSTSQLSNSQSGLFAEAAGPTVAVLGAAGALAVATLMVARGNPVLVKFSQAEPEPEPEAMATALLESEPIAHVQQ